MATEITQAFAFGGVAFAGLLDDHRAFVACYSSVVDHHSPMKCDLCAEKVVSRSSLVVYGGAPRLTRMPAARHNKAAGSLQRIIDIRSVTCYYAQQLGSPNGSNLPR